MNKADTCFGWICFFRLEASAPKFFGFSEFLAALALLVLVWTVVEIRFTFRIQSAPIPIERITFGAVAGIGLLALLTDLWRAEQWYVPSGPVLTPASWQAVLGAALLLTFLLWAWFAFIRPPLFGWANARRFESAVTARVLKGSQVELAVVASELQRSAGSLVELASRAQKNPSSDELKKNAHVYAANRILHLIADRRFCKAMVEGAPGAIVAIFLALRASTTPPAVGSLARNILRAALASPDSFLYHETDLLDAGLLGYHKPVSAALFGSHELCASLRDSLYLDYTESRSYSPRQWEAYGRCALLVLNSFVKAGDLGAYPDALHQAFESMEDAARRDQRWTRSQSAPPETASFEYLSVSMNFLTEAIKIVDAAEPPSKAFLRSQHRAHLTAYDWLSDLGFELACVASTIRAPANSAWLAQYNIVWGDLLEPTMKSGRGAALIRKKVRRLILDEVRRLESFPNYKSAPLLGMCLNILGIRPGRSRRRRETEPLHQCILAWTKRNYAQVHRRNPRVAEACLVDGFTFEVGRARIWKTNPMDALRHKPRYWYLDVEP